MKSRPWRPDLGMEPATGELRIPTELIAELRRMRRRRRLFMLSLKPFLWAKGLASGLGLGRRRGGGPKRDAGNRSGKGSPQALAASGTRAAHGAPSQDASGTGSKLVNARHGCCLELPPGAEALEVSRKPSAVFAFRIQDVQVTCTSRRREQIEEVLRRPSRSKVLLDEKLQVGPLKARQLFFDLPARFTSGSDERTCLALYVVQTEPALYVFLFRCPGRPSQELVDAVSGVVRTFSLLPRPVNS